MQGHFQGSIGIGEHAIAWYLNPKSDRGACRKVGKRLELCFPIQFSLKNFANSARTMRIWKGPDSHGSF